jgi:NADH-quinone oxidoreductase subunit K
VSPLGPLLLAALLFSVGVYGVIARRNAVLVLMSVELMLNAVNINLVAFQNLLFPGDPAVSGQMFALFIIGVAAAEVGVGPRHRLQPVPQPRDGQRRRRRPDALVGGHPWGPSWSTPGWCRCCRSSRPH